MHDDYPSPGELDMPEPIAKSQGSETVHDDFGDTIHVDWKCMHWPDETKLFISLSMGYDFQGKPETLRELAAAILRACDKAEEAARG